MYILSKNTSPFFELGDTSANTTDYMKTDEPTVGKDNELDEIEQDETELFRYLSNSYYYVTTTYTSVGYGDIVPKTACAKAFSMLISIDGFFMSAVIIGLILESFKGK